MKFLVPLLISIALFGSDSLAQNFMRTNDSDLTGVRTVKLRSRSNVRGGNSVQADHVQEGAAAKGLAIQFVRMVKNQETPVEGLAFKAQLKNNGPTVTLKSDIQGVVRDTTCDKATVSFPIILSVDKFKVTTGSADYTINVTAKCGVEQKFIFDEKTENAQPIAIWQVAVRAGKRLSQTVGTQFWKRTIAFAWPADGDYYNFDTVHLTLGYQWDVVAHEMGHAIYDQAQIGQFGGGQHYIDRCYSETLALSEGWASFFSSFVNADLRDPDAKFEYMVPRRAPIRFENVPADVCGRSTNEWRVNAFLWDLIDLHDDGETFEETFQRLWVDTAGARASSLKALKSRLVQKGWDSAKLDTIWKLNFPAE